MWNLGISYNLGKLRKSRKTSKISENLNIIGNHDRLGSPSKSEEMFENLGDPENPWNIEILEVIGHIENFEIVDNIENVEISKYIDIIENNEISKYFDNIENIEIIGNIEIIENIENIEIIENMENIEIIELMISNISKYQNIIENVHTCSILHLSFSILSGNLENL